MTTIIVATKNAHKVREMNELLADLGSIGKHCRYEFFWIIHNRLASLKVYRSTVVYITKSHYKSVPIGLALSHRCKMLVADSIVIVKMKHGKTVAHLFQIIINVCA